MIHTHSSWAGFGKTADFEANYRLYVQGRT